MLGEPATTEFARRRIAGEARERLELEPRNNAVLSGNYLIEPESRKRLSGKQV